ncbi:hypothetical protein [Mesorhizobium sp. NZP2234]|uniref:hypothetical protein n=1 Tax=Mesorhizobium sp. NZP2234 TaxID=2483402 RepID=UPI001556822E|nr:hypothetical protein [Mesorhizobium sp. NZP2234]
MNKSHHFTDAELAEHEFSGADLATLLFRLGLGSAGLALFLGTFMLGVPLGAMLFGAPL